MAETFTKPTPPPITSNNYDILSIFNNLHHQRLGSTWDMSQENLNKIGSGEETTKKKRQRQKTEKKKTLTERAKSTTRRKTMTFSNPCAHRKTFRRKNLVELLTRYCTLILNQLIVCSWYNRFTLKSSLPLMLFDYLH